MTELNDNEQQLKRYLEQWRDLAAIQEAREALKRPRT
jgi:hypothetical protein